MSQQCCWIKFVMMLDNTLIMITHLINLSILLPYLTSDIAVTDQNMLTNQHLH